MQGKVERDSSAGTSNLMHQQFVTCSEHPIWKEMVSLMSMASMPPPNHTQSWGLFVAKQQFFFKR